MSKLRKDGLLACDIFTFVDDERLVGPTRELTYQAAHTMAAKQAYMGVQDSSLYSWDVYRQNLCLLLR